jgi:hypothetical protein
MERMEGFGHTLLYTKYIVEREIEMMHIDLG